MQAGDLQVAVHLQPALGVARRGDLLGERAGAEADGPDHRVGVDALAVVQHRASGIHRGDRTARAPFDAQLAGGLDDGRANAFAQRRADLRATVDDDDPDLGILAQDGAQAGRELGGGFDPGEAAAGHHHGVAGGAGRPVRQGEQVLLEARGLLDLVDIEGVLGQARHGRTEQLAAGGEDEPVVAQRGLVACRVAVGDLAAIGVDGQRQPLDETHAGGGEQVQQRRPHAVHLGLVEARADAQFGLGREQRHAHIGAAVLVEQTYGAQGTPQPGESGPYDQYVLSHDGSPGMRRFV
ncbi:hypothetical protein D9M70_406920 [compost metagenome]